MFHLLSGSVVVTELSLRLAVSFAQILAEMSIVMITVATMTYFERKVLGWMQDRMGPMEVGPYGLLQPVADGIKLFFKEDIVPAGANKAMFALAPMLTMIVSLIGFAVIPFGPNMTWDIYGMTIKPSSSPTSTSGSCTSWRLPQSAPTALSWVAGHPTASTHCWEACAPRPRSSATS